MGIHEPECLKFFGDKKLIPRIFFFITTPKNKSRSKKIKIDKTDKVFFVNK